jgi:proline dehydrogenase
MLDAASKAFFHTLAGSRALKRLASRYGFRPRGGFARRFIAGEDVDQALEATRALQAAGLRITLDHLGESVTSAAEADAATRTYLSLLDRIVAAGVERNVSLKLTQLGLSIDRATCLDNLRRVLDGSAPHGFFVRVDMEDSSVTEVTLDIVETLWGLGYQHAGVALQSMLLRSEEDLRRVNRIGLRVRLIKGAYNEPRTVAYHRKADVDAAFVRMMQTLLAEGVYPAIATHDVRMIEATKRFAAERDIARDKFEFQMLYGIRRDLQAQLIAEGYRMRVYVPFGREWFPYFMRRLGERPANVAFVLRGILGER